MVAQLIEFLAKKLVNDPEAVEVTELDPSLYELKVAEEDRGKIIGKKGRTAFALRSIIGAASTEQQKPAIDIVD